MSEKGRTEPNKIDLEFPGLIARVNLFGRIPRCAPEGRWDKWSRQFDCLSMGLPDIANQDVPVPEPDVIRWINLDCAMPETK